MTEPILTRLLAGNSLRRREASEVLRLLFDRRTSDPLRAGLLVALSSKGETREELVGLAEEMRRRCRPFPGPRSAGAIDLCGTGGADRPAFNVGTTAAFVVRAAGLPVAKHGNRSARGARRGYAGSSELLSALGLPFDRSRAFARACFRREGITFLHAPLYHPATRAVRAVREALGVPTVFNLLGPLTNPAKVKCQVVGCRDATTAYRLARALPALGVRAGMTVCGGGGSDEFAPRGITTVWRWNGGDLLRRTVRAEDWLEADDRRGSWAALPAPQAAEECRRILAGGTGARRGSVLLTAAAALLVGGVADRFGKGLDRAVEALDSGAAEQVLGRLERLANRRVWGEGA